MRAVKDNYSLPRNEHQLAQLIGAECFSTLDLKSWYWQVELMEEANLILLSLVSHLGFMNAKQCPLVQAMHQLLSKG